MSFPREGVDKESPWERVTPPGCITEDFDIAEDDIHYILNHRNKRPKFDAICYENKYLDISTKRAALIASPCVVSMVTYSDDKEIFRGSGTIIENDGTILTSAYLVRSPTGENVVANNIKIIVYLSDGKSYEAQVVVHDFHYNFTIVKIQSPVPLPRACLAIVNDCLSVDPSERFVIRPHSSSRTFTLSPGDVVIALGRHFSKPYEVMVAPGEFSIKRRQSDCNYECKELFMSTCKISTAGIGGPLVNGNGEVIGVIFHNFWCTPFTPINIAVKWWNHYKLNRELRRPWIGMELANLYVIRFRIIEKLIQKMPNNFTGVLVEEVVEGSSAEVVGIRPNDLIIECCGKAVRGFLEFFDIVWDKTGSCIDLVVIRASEDTPLHFTMAVAETTHDKFYRWQLLNDSTRLI